MAIIQGTTENNVLNGTDDKDSFVFTPGHGNDTIVDFATGTDIIDLSGFGQEISWEDLNGKITEIVDPDDPNTITGIQIDLTEWGGGTITLNGITSVSDLDEDSFTYPTVTVTIGTDDADLLMGDAGMDKLIGGGGGDILDAGCGNDEVRGGDGMDLVLGGGGNDTLYGDGGVDLVDGGTGNDHVYGGEGNDTLNGGAGEDTIYGGEGDDTLWGDYCAPSSADTFVIGIAEGNDTIKDFEDGLDRIDLSAFENIEAVSDLVFTQNGSNVVIDLSTQNGGSIILEDFDLADLDDTDFIFHDTSTDAI